MSFLCWWNLQRGYLKKSPCRCKKRLKRKTHHFCKTWLTEFCLYIIHFYFEKKYTWSINLETFLWKIEQFLKLFGSKLFGGSLKISTKYCVTKSEEEQKLPNPLKHVLKSLPPYIFFFKVTYFFNIILETFHWNLIHSWIYSEAIFATYPDPKTPLQMLFKTNCNNLF